MPTTTINGHYPAALLVRGNPDNPVSTMIANIDANNTFYVGDSPSMQPTDQTVIPIATGASIVCDGTVDVYGICVTGQTAQVSTLANVTSVFNI
jgi:hypothetical protein